MILCFQQSWNGGLSLTTTVKVDAVTVASCKRRCADAVFLFNFWIVQIQGRGLSRVNTWTMFRKIWVWKEFMMEMLIQITFFDLLVPDDWLGQCRISLVYHMSKFYCFHSINSILVYQSLIMSSITCINALQRVPETSKITLRTLKWRSEFKTAVEKRLRC